MESLGRRISGLSVSLAVPVALLVMLFASGCAPDHHVAKRRIVFDHTTTASTNGATSCPADQGLTNCGGRCIATARDPANCGGCGVHCTAGQVCAMGVCVSHFEAAGALGDPGTWTEYGPNLGGRLSGVFAADVSGSRYLLVSSPGGGVWRTTTGAAPWTEPAPSPLGFADYSTLHLERDRMNASRLYLSTYSDVYATTDYGNSWTDLTQTGAYPQQLLPDGSMLFDPRPFAQMCCSWDGSGNCTSTRVFQGPPCGGLRYSLDNGSTFSQTWPFSGWAGNEDNCIAGIAAEDNVTPDAGRVYIATMAHGGPAHVYVSDPTCNWCTSSAACTADWEPAWGSGSLALPAVQFDTASRIAWAGSASQPHRVEDVLGDGAQVYEYYTNDGGLTNANPPGTWIQSSFVNGAIPGGRGLLSVQGDLFTDNAGPGYYYKGANGWLNPFVTGEHHDTRAEFADPAIQSVYSVNDGAGMGDEWNITHWNWTGPGSDPSGGTGIGADGLHVWQAYTTAVAPTSSGVRVWLGAQDNGLVCTEDGVNWYAYGIGDVNSVQVHPVDTDRAYYFGGTVIEEATTASSSASCADVKFNLKYTVGWASPPGPNSLALDPRAGQQDVLAVSAGAVKLSTDGASSFRQASGPPTGYVTSVYIDDQGYVYAGTESSGVWRCDTALPSPPPAPPTPFTLPCLSATHWSEFGSMSSPPRYITAVRKTHPSGADPTYWAGTTSGLYRKTPTQDWTVMTGGANYTVNEIETMPGYPNCVYAGLGFVATHAQHRGGVRFSADNGVHWSSITAGVDVHESPIGDLDTLTGDPYDLLAATYGRGFWIYSWSALPTGCGG